MLKAPRFVGDDIAFRLMAAKSYGLAPVIDQDEIDRVVTANVQLAAADALTNMTPYATARTVRWRQPRCLLWPGAFRVLRASLRGIAVL